MKFMDQERNAQKEEKKEEEESVGMLGKLLASRTVIISGPVTAEAASKTIQQLILLDHDDGKKRVTLLVNSPGGEFHSGFAIYDMIRFISAPVITVVVGLAASMGSIIPLAASKGSRYALPHSKFLIHPVPTKSFTLSFIYSLAKETLMVWRFQPHRHRRSRVRSPVRRCPVRR